MTLVPDPAIELLDGKRPGITERLVDGGQRGPEVGRLRHVVDTDHGEVVRDPSTGLVRGVLGALPDVDAVFASNDQMALDQRFHASMILGFTDSDALRAFFDSAEIATLAGKLREHVSAVHAYEVTEALTYVKDGNILPNYQT